MGLVTAPVELAFSDVDGLLCPRSTIEDVFASGPVDFARELDNWRSIMRSAEVGDYASVLQQEGGVNLAQPPEGISWQRWAGWIELRMAELADDPQTVFRQLPQYVEPWRLRAGELDLATQDVVRRTLAATPLPQVQARRGYLVLDTAEPIGTAARLDRETGEAREVPTSRIGVVLERTDRLRVLGVHAADPVADPRTDEWRDRWPVLASALGGWFSEAAFENFGPWMAQYRMLTLEPDERLGRLADEGHELLQLGDDDLHAAVVALGCYVEPSYLRLWLEWMFWRIGYFDWK